MDWPLDVFEPAADKARQHELHALENSREQRIAEVAEAGQRKKVERQARSLGLPPLFLDG